jgi:thiamine pyrophosphate-dependent acetolactate synthase large subunit-like protein
VITKEVIARGHTVMQSDPQGPVFLALPREVLAETWPADQVRSFPPQRYGAVSAEGASPETVQHIAESLLQAEHPVVFTSYLGRKAEAVQALEALAMACGIRVVEFNPNAMSISRHSICFAGFDPTQQVPLADLGLLLDVDVPFMRDCAVSTAISIRSDRRSVRMAITCTDHKTSKRQCSAACKPWTGDRRRCWSSRLLHSDGVVFQTEPEAHDDCFDRSNHLLPTPLRAGFCLTRPGPTLAQ